MTGSKISDRGGNGAHNRRALSRSGDATFSREKPIRWAHMPSRGAETRIMGGGWCETTLQGAPWPF